MEQPAPDTSFVRLDLEELLQKHKPAIAKRLPRFIIRKLEKIVHIDLINDFLQEHFNDDPEQFLEHAVQWMQIDLDLVHPERLKENLDKRPIVVANHPLGGPESILLMHAIVKTHPGMRMMSQELLLKLKPIAPLLAPVPQSNGRAFPKALLQAFANDQPLLLFPAGYCSRPLSFGEVYDFVWYKTFAKVAHKYGRLIIPVHNIDGTNSHRFYRLSALRRFLHIKPSLESVYLVDEMVKQRGRKLTMTIGQLIEPDLLTKDIKDQEWTDRIRQYVYQLGRDPGLAFDPILPATLPLR
jgi:putative hemolysin